MSKIQCIITHNRKNGKEKWYSQESLMSIKYWVIPKLLLKYDYFYVNSFYILFEIIIFTSDVVELG